VRDQLAELVLEECLREEDARSGCARSITYGRLCRKYVACDYIRDQNHRWRGRGRGRGRGIVSCNVMLRFPVVVREGEVWRVIVLEREMI